MADDPDGWGGNFLAPILRNAGYRVVVGDDASDEVPDVLLYCTDEEECLGSVNGEVPVIRLRTSIAAAGPEDETVYRYDRQALLDALRRQVGGERT